MTKTAFKIEKETRFGVAFTVDKELAERYKGSDYIQHKKDHSASELGRGIMKHKGWQINHEENHEHYYTELLVFTPEEFKEVKKKILRGEL